MNTKTLIHTDRHQADREHRILLALAGCQRDVTNLAHQIAAALEVSLEDFAEFPTMGRILIELLREAEAFKADARFNG